MIYCIIKKNQNQEKKKTKTQIRVFLASEEQVQVLTGNILKSCSLYAVHPFLDL